MRLIVRPILNPWKSSRSWLLLVGVVLFWIMARVIVPTSAGAELPGYWLPSCPFRKLTGIPCPFCGITTGSSWLVHGYWREAWMSNILSPLLMIGAAVFGSYAVIFRLAAGVELNLEIGPGARRLFWLAVLGMVVMSWAINLIRAFQ